MSHFLQYKTILHGTATRGGETQMKLYFMASNPT
jgi:hypothetical protein